MLFVDVYIAPEVYKNETFDKSVDVYSFGVMLFEVYLTIHIEALSVRTK